MKKRTIAMMAGAGAAAAVTCYLNMDKLQETAQKVNDKVKSDRKDSLPIEQSGSPNPEDLENNKMVSEGSQFGPNYYHNYKYAETEQQ